MRRRIWTKRHANQARPRRPPPPRMRTTARRPPGPMCWSGNVPGRVWTQRRKAQAPPESAGILGFRSYPCVYSQRAYCPWEHHPHAHSPHTRSTSEHPPPGHRMPHCRCAPQACATAWHGAAQVHAAKRTTERPPPHLHGPSSAARLGAPIPDTMRTPTPHHCAQARKPVAQGAVGILPRIADTAPHPGHRIRRIPGETERKTQPSRRIVQTHRQTTRALARLGARLHAEHQGEPHAGEHAEQRAQHGTKPVSANESAGDSD